MSALGGKLTLSSCAIGANGRCGLRAYPLNVTKSVPIEQYAPANRPIINSEAAVEMWHVTAADHLTIRIVDHLKIAKLVVVQPGNCRNIRSLVVGRVMAQFVNDHVKVSAARSQPDK